MSHLPKATQLKDKGLSSTYGRFRQGGLRGRSEKIRSFHQKKKNINGNSLAFQWLRVGTFTIKSLGLVEELRPCKQCGMAKENNLLSIYCVWGPVPGHSWGQHSPSLVCTKPSGSKGLQAQSPASEPWHSTVPSAWHTFPQITAWLSLPTSSAEGIESLGNPCPYWVCSQFLLLLPLLLLPCWLSLPCGSRPLPLSLCCDSEGQRRRRRPRKVTALTLVAGLCSRSRAGLLHTVSLSLRPLIGCVYEHQDPCSAPLLCEGRAAPDG